MTRFISFGPFFFLVPFLIIFVHSLFRLLYPVTAIPTSFLYFIPMLLALYFLFIFYIKYKKLDIYILKKFNSEPMSSEDKIKIQNMIDELTQKIDVPSPTLLTTFGPLWKMISVGKGADKASLLIPRDLIDSLEPHELRCAIAHELWHIKTDVEERTINQLRELKNPLLAFLMFLSYAFFVLTDLYSRLPLSQLLPYSLPKIFGIISMDDEVGKICFIIAVILCLLLIIIALFFRRLSRFVFTLVGGLFIALVFFVSLPIASIYFLGILMYPSASFYLIDGFFLFFLLYFASLNLISEMLTPGFMHHSEFYADIAASVVTRSPLSMFSAFNKIEIKAKEYLRKTDDKNEFRQLYFFNVFDEKKSKLIRDWNDVFDSVTSKRPDQPPSNCRKNLIILINDLIYGSVEVEFVIDNEELLKQSPYEASTRWLTVSFSPIAKDLRNINKLVFHKVIEYLKFNKNNFNIEKCHSDFAKMNIDVTDFEMVIIFVSLLMARKIRVIKPCPQNFF